MEIWIACPIEIPKICGIVFLNPNLIPEIVSMVLFGPGVINMTV